MKSSDPLVSDFDVVPFTVAEMELETPHEIKEGLKDYLDKEILGYTVPSIHYYESLSRWTKTHYNYDVEKEDVFITSGVVNAIKIAINTMTQMNDGIVILTPAYNAFFDVIKSTKRSCVSVPLINDNGYYTIDFESLEDALSKSENTMFILCSPHNPIGRVWNKNELETIHRLSKKHNVTVISDEIHADIILPGNSFVSYAHINPQAVICTSITKTFNLAGLKISNIIIKDKVVMEKWQEYASMYGGQGANALGMMALELAYSKCEPWLRNTIELLSDNYNHLCSLLKDSDYCISPLEGTYLLWIDCSKVKGAYHRLKDYHQHTSPGKWYGTSSDYIRVNLACETKYISQLGDIMIEIAKDTK